MILDEWQKRWGISDLAIHDLKTLLGVTDHHKTSIHAPKTEADVSVLVRLEASKKGGRLWRNNVGATYTKDGNFLRYGLANDSATLNTKVKSSDLIGIKPVLITPYMVGKTIGQFISREVKHPNWKYSGSNREEAQLAWINLIVSLGGDACFATNEGTL